MKLKRKIVIMATACILGITSIVPTLAASAGGNTPQLRAQECGACGGIGTLKTEKSTNYFTTQKTCIHGKKGYDLVRTPIIYYRNYCTNCGYEYSYQQQGTTFRICMGY